MVKFMNRFLVLFIAVAFTLSFALSCSGKSLTQDQRNQIVNVIDNTCADSWCEGDYDFDFIDFKCHESDKSCDLVFRFINTDADVEKKSSLQNCHFLNITKLEQVLVNYNMLNVDFYETLDACISNLENKFI
jgi:hypothetical protein